MIFDVTRNFLRSEIQFVFRFLRKFVVKPNPCAIISPRGEKCGLALHLFLLIFLVGATPAYPDVTLEAFTFETPNDEERFKGLIEELRCLVCQNQSLADSDAELAHDLRAEVYTMMKTGRSDDEIIQFLVARYGDFVLYNPPVKPSTYLLWYGPFVLLLIATLLLLRAVRRQKKSVTPEISAEERKRLDAMLSSSDPDRNDRR